MALTLFYITNHPVVARIAEDTGVDRIFIDMEHIGKAQRQRGMDTVQLNHSVKDVERLRAALCRAELLVRVNPIHGNLSGEMNSREEINAVIGAGADCVMLPYFKTAGELSTFAEMVNGRAKTVALLETVEAAESVAELAKVDGIDEFYIGINDLSIGLGKKFMFELFCDGTVERISEALVRAGKPFGIGGIASIGKGLLPSEYVIREHYRLGSSMAILSRSFCNVNQHSEPEEIRQLFEKGIRDIRALEQECSAHTPDSAYFRENALQLRSRVEQIVESLSKEDRV